MAHLAIEASGLTKHYGRIAAVSSLDLGVTPGTVVGFLGPNGSGKTTTIRMLLGLVRPTTGSARIFGHDVVRDRRAVAPLVGAIVDTPTAFPFLTGRETLRMLANSSEIAVSGQEIASLLDRVGLGPRADSRVGTYSLGMRQRLGIAGALLGRPKVLFLDEPTNGLDPEGTVEIRELVGELGREGYTIFLTSHLLDEVERVCGEVVFVRGGRVVAEGAVGDLVGIRGVRIVASPRDRALAILREIPSASVTETRDGHLELRCDRSAVPYAVLRLSAAGVDVYEVTPTGRRLEEIYLEVAGADARDVKEVVS